MWGPGQVRRCWRVSVPPWYKIPSRLGCSRGVKTEFRALRQPSPRSALQHKIRAKPLFYQRTSCPPGGVEYSTLSKPPAPGPGQKAALSNISWCSGTYSWHQGSSSGLGLSKTKLLFPKARLVSFLQTNLATQLALL